MRRACVRWPWPLPPSRSGLTDNATTPMPRGFVRACYHTDRPGRERGDSGCAGESGRALLPTHPRLSGAVLAGLADPQAEGDSPGPGRTAAGGSGGGVERPPGESPASLALAVVTNPLADVEAEMDLAAAEDDAEGEPLLCGA